jgi:hypothetical protein
VLLSRSCTFKLSSSDRSAYKMAEEEIPKTCKAGVVVSFPVEFFSPNVGSIPTNWRTW